MRCWQKKQKKKYVCMQIQCSISIQIFSGAEVMYCIELNILFFYYYYSNFQNPNDHVAFVFLDILCANIMFTQKKKRNKISCITCTKTIGENKQSLQYNHAFFCSDVSRSYSVFAVPYLDRRLGWSLFSIKPSAAAAAGDD